MNPSPHGERQSSGVSSSGIRVLSKNECANRVGWGSEGLEDALGQGGHHRFLGWTVIKTSPDIAQDFETFVTHHFSPTLRKRAGEEFTQHRADHEPKLPGCLLTHALNQSNSLVIGRTTAGLKEG
jgi:hypothetical protein